MPPSDKDASLAGRAIIDKTTIACLQTGSGEGTRYLAARQILWELQKSPKCLWCHHALQMKPKCRTRLANMRKTMAESSSCRPHTFETLEQADALKDAHAKSHQWEVGPKGEAAGEAGLLSGQSPGTAMGQEKLQNPWAGPSATPASPRYTCK